MNENFASHPPAHHLPPNAAGEFEPPDKGMYVLGMTVFIISLSILFAAIIVGYVVVRYSSPQWRLPHTPPPPLGLWLSTGLLVGCSLVIQRALNKIRLDQCESSRRALRWALGLGVAFLLVQTLNWTQMILARLTIHTGFYGFMFYALTGLHALHVLGGAGQLAVITRRSQAGHYDANHHIGITTSAMYWHFLDAVWLVIFFCLEVIS